MDQPTCCRTVEESEPEDRDAFKLAAPGDPPVTLQSIASGLAGLQATVVTQLECIQQDILKKGQAELEQGQRSIQQAIKVLNTGQA